MATPYLRPRLLIAYAQALRLTLAAQSVTARPLTQVIDQLTRQRGLPHRLAVADGIRAALAAVRHLGRAGYLDSCLVQALVLGTLLCDAHDVELVIGFRPADQRDDHGDIAGHAWLTVDGHVYLQEAAASHYVSSRSFTIRRA